MTERERILFQGVVVQGKRSAMFELTLPADINMRQFLDFGSKQIEYQAWKIIEAMRLLPEAE